MFSTTELAVMVRENFAKDYVETIRRDTNLLGLLQPSQIKTAEKDLRWKINYAGNASVGSYGETDAFNTPGEQLYATAAMDWKLNQVTIKVTGLAQAISKSENAVFEALAQETELALKDMKREIELQLLGDGTGNSGKDITGIEAAIDDGGAVATYAGIARGANLWWRSYVLDNGGTDRPLTEALIMQAIQEVKAIRGGKITHALCSYPVFNALAQLLVQERRQVNPGQSLEGGWETINFNGISVTAVPDYPVKRMDLVDLSLFEYHILKEMQVEPRDPGMVDAMQFVCTHYSQLLYKDPRRSASIRDILV